MSRRAKIAAALAAVNAYLAEETAAANLAASAARQAAPPRGPSPWAVAGRLRLMNERLAIATATRR